MRFIADSVVLIIIIVITIIIVIDRIVSVSLI